MKISKRFDRFVCGVVCSAIAPLALAHGDGDSVTQAIEYRQAVMNVYLWNVKPMGAMVKGKQEYDQEAFKGYARDLAAAAKLELLRAFPEDSDQGETDALPDIWLDFEGFENKLKALQEAAQSLQEAANSGDEEQTKAAFADVGKTCKGCHESFRE